MAINTGNSPAAVLLLIALSAGSAASAAEKLALLPGMAGVPDLGAIDCATFTHMFPNGPTGMRQAVLTWAQGYFYARSGKTTDQLLAGLPTDNPWDFSTLTGHIVDYCAAHPDSPVPEAVIDLWSKLGAP